MNHTSSARRQKLFALAISLSAIGFSTFGDSIRVYSVPKEHAHTAGTDSAGIPTTDTGAAPIHWKTPTGWKELTPTSVRIGNFLVGSGDKKAEVAITSFPGTVGGEAENVTRWRREIGLGPIAVNEITSEKTLVGTMEAKLYDFTGASARTVVAWLQREGHSWFFKLKGDKDLVADTRKAFLGFLTTVSFEEGGETVPSVAPVADAGQLPAGHPDISGSAPATAGGELPAGHPDISASAPATPAAPADAKDAAAEPNWTIPSNWKEKPAGMMVLKSFNVENESGAATIAISSFPGQVGGKLANVNRWRRQMGLQDIEEADLGKETQVIDVAGGKATLVDFKGTDAKSGKAARLVAVMVPHGEDTWFYKLLGDDAAVAREKDKFVKFVQTVRY